MRNLLSFIGNKSLWSVLFLVIGVWSALSFYWIGYDKGTRVAEREVLELQAQIMILQHSSSIVSFVPETEQNSSHM